MCGISILTFVDKFDCDAHPPNLMNGIKEILQIETYPTD